MSCESWDGNAKYDVLSKPIQGNLLDPITCYLGEHMEKYLTHPYASPLFGTFAGLPPMLVQAGDAEVLRDEITLLAYKASLAGVKVRHELYEDAVRRISVLSLLTFPQFRIVFHYTGTRIPHLPIFGSLSPSVFVLSRIRQVPVTRLADELPGGARRKN